MRTWSRLAPLAGAVLLLAAGCQPINKKMDATIEATYFKKWEFDAPRYKQNLKITVSPSGGPVSAWLVKESDAKALEDALASQKEPQASGSLASKISKDKAEEYTLEATVPAGTPYVLFVKAEKTKADVTVTVKGR